MCTVADIARASKLIIVINWIISTAELHTQQGATQVVSRTAIYLFTYVKRGYIFKRISLFVCLSLCLLEGLLKNY